MTTAPTSRAFSISKWRPAPIRVDGETVFAVGDVHGCAEQLKELLANITEMSRIYARARLIFLGDLICRARALPACQHSQLRREGCSQ